MLALPAMPVASGEEAQFSLVNKAQFYYSFRNLNQNIDNIQTSSDGIFIGSSNLVTEMGSFHFEARPEIRVIAGNNTQLSTSNPAYLQLESPIRSLETRFHLGSPGDSAILYGDWEKLNLSYSNETLELSVGRKPFSLGVLKFLSVWNKFSRPVPGLTLIPIYYGADGGSIKLKFGEWVIDASQHIYNLGSDQISTGQLIYYGDFANLHFMVGNWWKQTVFGAALAKDVLEGTFNSEYLNYGSAFQWGNGYERALGEKFSFAIETIYQSAGASDPLNYTPMLRSHFQIFQASFYSYEILNFQCTPLLKLSAGGLTNWIDLGTAMNLGANYSINDHLELGIDSLIPALRPNAEFSSRTFLFSDGTSFGVPLQIVSHLDWTF